MLGEDENAEEGWGDGVLCWGVVSRCFLVCCLGRDIGLPPHALAYWRGPLDFGSSVDFEGIGILAVM